MTASFALTIMLVFSFSVILDFAKQLVPSLSVTSADIALSSYANKMDIERSLEIPVYCDGAPGGKRGGRSCFYRGNEEEILGCQT